MTIPRTVTITCPVCRKGFEIHLTFSPRATFTWSGTKSFLSVDVGASAVEHPCVRPNVVVTDAPPATQMRGHDPNPLMS